MASHAIVLQNLSLIPSSSHSSFFPAVIQPRISFVSRFDSVVLKAYLPTHHLQPSAGERLETESSTGGNKSSNEEKKKGKKELRPNFYHQTLKKWSVKISSRRTKLPWQEQGVEERERVVHGSPATGMPAEPSNNRNRLVFFEGRAKSRSTGSDFEVDSSDHVEKLPRSSNHARPRNLQYGVVESNPQTEANCIKLGIPLSTTPWAQRLESERSSLEHNKLFLVRDPGLSDSSYDEEPSSSRSTVSSSIRTDGELQIREVGAISLPSVIAKTRKSQFNVGAASTIPSQALKCDAESPNSRVSAIIEKRKESMDKCSSEDASSYIGSYHEKIPTISHVDNDNLRDSLSFPWENESGVSKIKPLRRRSNTDLAERTIPEPELRRLRNVALRMKERMKIGPAGLLKLLLKIFIRNGRRLRWSSYI